MSLNKLALFKNVKITPDYSVVHDMDIETWKNYLMGWLDPMPPDSDTPELVHTQTINYYRMPEVIRVEGNYDAIRKATYGFLEDGRHEGNETLRTSFKLLFFWVKDVRLLKQSANVDNTDPSDPLWKDVCELDVELDVWSTYAGCFELYDSYVERRHMPRWKNEGTELVPDWKPIYYPNAAQGVEGVYRLEFSEDAYKNTLAEFTWNPFGSGPEDAKASLYFVQINVLKNDGQCKMYGIPIVIVRSKNYWYHVNVFYQPASPSVSFYNLEQIITGKFYTDMGITADFVQSIVIYPMMSNLADNVTFDGSVLPPTATINLEQFVYLTPSVYTGTPNKAYFDLSSTGSQLRASHRPQSKSVTVIGPDHDAVGQANYDDEAEPMMYFMPARQRKVVTSLGGEVFTIPDVAALENVISMLSLSELSAGSVFVYFGEDIVEANALGACGVLDCATLPIYNSAWKSYEAISKVSDTMMFNAKQMQTIGGGLTNTGLAGVGGFVQGGPAGAILGVVGGSVGTILGAVGNEEELKAKQLQIKNSPCNVKSSGSGVTAAIEGLVTMEYVTLKMDDQSMEKLRYMYYWYGYNVNRSFKGIIDLETREVFDFIKTNGAKVKGDLTAGAAKQIGAIFDQGVTIYHGAAGYALIGTGNMVSNDEV